MSTNANALDGVLDLLVDFVSPLADSAQEGGVELFLAGRSWMVVDIDSDAVSTAVTTIVDTIKHLNVETASLTDLVTTLRDLAGAGQAIAGLADTLADSIGGTSASALSALLGPLAADTLDGLAVGLIETRWARAYRVLQILGLIDEVTPTPLSSGGASPLLSRVALARASLKFDAFGPLLSDPGAHLRARLGFAGAADQAEAERIIRSTFLPLARLAEEVGATTVVGGNRLPANNEERRLARSAAFFFSLPTEALDPSLDAWFSVVAEVRPATLGPAGLALTPSGGVTYERALGGGTLQVGMTGEPGAVFFPSAGGPPVLEANDGQGVEFSLGYARTSATGSALVIGSSTTGLIIEGLHAMVRARLGRTGAEGLDVVMGAGLDKASFVIKPAPGDGFLAKVLPADGLVMNFALGLEWSNEQGLRFTGAGSLQADLPIHLDLLGVLKIEVLHLQLGVDEHGLLMAVAADIDLKLGPIAATVQGMGLAAGVAPAQQTPGIAKAGNLGPVDLNVKFVPPKGIGFVVDASVVKGGGFVLNDPVKGRYAGALELRIADLVSVTAIGLVTTKLPDGSEGFSLVVIITATFPPIQIGFGFSLSGLGGLVGIHRTMELPALRDKVRTGALDSILFPVDPVNRITEVLSDIESVFPAAQGRFTFGVLARLGWGSPQLVQVDLGLIISLPAPLSIALIGRLSAALPDKEAAVVVLHLDVAGGLDLGRKELWVEAVLHDSRVAIFDISGGFALRTAWGDEPTFILSVGGFNPTFTPPANFNPPARVTIALGSSDNPRIALSCYLAVTSNTVQMGANLDVHAEATFLGVWSVDLYAGFDALVVLVPFSFVVDFSGGVMIKHDGSPFIGASFLLSLSGPQPVNACGYAEVEFFGTHRVPFDITVGEPAPAVELTAVDPLEQLLAAIESVESWSTLPPAGSPSVATRDLAGTGLFAHPLGALGFRQRVVPLDVAIERFAGLRLAGGPRQYSLAYSFVSGGAPTPAQGRSPVRDAWAPADLFTLTDDQKLSLPSFTQLVSGDAAIAIAGAAAGSHVNLDLDSYETSVIDADEWAPARLDLSSAYARREEVATFLHQANGHEDRLRTGLLAPAMKVALAEPEFAIASTETLATDGQKYASWVEARAAAGGKRDWQLVDAHEVVA